MDCKRHPGVAAAHACRQCGTPLCEGCFDPATGACRDGCKRTGTAGGMIPGRNVWVKTLVSILAIIGAITVLLLALCAGILFTNLG
ncbi:hypothetical protein FE782_01550 [Paenibacillus antri]|uniref:B box-type domain-containing protein n=1 Tax=Paenibacillus antri TaxID=2582848 RepID=A0A5R9GIE2_9BACL|nr:hypothetical protein [Paenibacillus antri]TLS54060.1 hypothetical protein FE782_01550 [Paenibacillus antri]